MQNSRAFDPKRRCKHRTPNVEDPKSDNSACSHSNSGLPEVLMLMIGAMPSYIRAGGHLGSSQLTNTCVLDSILAALHICYIKYPNIKSLLQSHTPFSEIMNYLNGESYNDGKLLWLKKLNRFALKEQMNIAGTVKDHLPMFDELVCAKIDYRQETPTHSPIYETTLSKFRAFGNVRALGEESNPPLILVDQDAGVDHKLLNLPVCPVTDGLNRRFELDFLLLGRDGHMVMCFSFFKDMWFLFDDDPARPAFRIFNYKNDLKDYIIYLAGYVNKTEANEYDHSVPETGVGTKPFNLGTTRQQENCSVDPVEGLLAGFSNLQCTGVRGLMCDSFDSE